MTSGDAQIVALRDTRTVAFKRLSEGRDGLLNDAIYVKRGAARAKRVATVRRLWDLRYVQGRLFAHVSLRGGRIAPIRDIGTPRERTLLLHSRRPTGVAISRTGRLAYGNCVRDKPRLRFVTAGGRHDRSHAVRWFPKAWTPDGRKVLVTSPGVRPVLGLMDPTSGRVKEIGSLACGFVTDAQFRGGDSDHEAVADRVLGHRARLDELQQVVGAARLGAGAGEAPAAERLAADHRAGDLAVDVEVADRRALADVARSCAGSGRTGRR